MIDGSSEPCIFCEIVVGHSPARVLLENETCISFLDIAPASRGHTLIVPKNHYRDIHDIDEEVLSDSTKLVKDVAKLLDMKLKPEGSTVFQMNQKAGWQTVFHFHFHVVPRWSEDTLIEPWVEKLGSTSELNEIHQLIMKRE